MDESSIEHKTEMIYEQFIVGLIAYNNERPMTINCIERKCKSLAINKIHPLDVIPDLIACGIIYANIDGGGKLYYQITEFGQYFFSTICKKAKVSTVIKGIRIEG